jgi:hypothetical protein
LGRGLGEAGALSPGEALLVVEGAGLGVVVGDGLEVVVGDGLLVVVGDGLLVVVGEWLLSCATAGVVGLASCCHVVRATTPATSTITTITANFNAVLPIL